MKAAVLIEPGKPLEIDALADSIADLSELAGVATPTIDTMLALLKLVGPMDGAAFGVMPIPILAGAAMLPTSALLNP